MKNIRLRTKLLIILIFVIALAGFYFFVLPPEVIDVSTNNISENVPIDSKIIIKFNKPIKRQEIQHSINPEIHGEWKFDQPLIRNHLYKTLIFEPVIDFEPDTQYEIKLNNIINPLGIGQTNKFSFKFKTQIIKKEIGKDVNIIKAEKTPVPINSKPKTTMLNITLDWQDDSLSCEAASLKMALAGKKVFVSEDQIMEKIGYDLTPRNGNIWGDPYNTYVGKIDGKICSTGFGVFWDPVAKAANNWRPSQSFSGWLLKDLINEIENGNPVMVWGAMPRTLNDCSWYTPEGKYIKAYFETHVRLVIGFIGPAQNPLKIIINDPLVGRVYWSTNYFLTNWGVFGYSGVAVR